MYEGLEELRARWRDSVLPRPLAFIAGGIALAIVTLAIDRAAPELLPGVLRFTAGNARLLLATLAGATLTVAGITFWVRAASVQLAAGQYSTRVVHGFLNDWFQQSMMGLLLGIFAYVVGVFRVVPDPQAPAGAAMPHLSILVAVALAGASVLAVLGAIRHSVQSMQAGALARRITDMTVARIRETHPTRGERDEPGPEERRPPNRRGRIVTAADSGWVQRIHHAELLRQLPPEATVRLEVRVGFFVIRGRPLATVWAAESQPELTQAIQRAVRLGRTRIMASDVDYGIQHLVDIAFGSLTHGAADVSSASEVIIHIEMVLRELGRRGLPPTVQHGPQGQRLLRPREFTYAQYVSEAFDRLRLAAAPMPSVAATLVATLGRLTDELIERGQLARAATLRRQARLTIAAAAAADLLPEDLETVREAARSHGLVDEAEATAAERPTGWPQPGAGQPQPGAGQPQGGAGQPQAAWEGPAPDDRPRVDHPGPA